ncbi:hypothetical protein KFU94_47690 [Chloroflexi bacterium TSY]|nr:hypothetical protein [Chloroflexi bacterium TSY]
MQAQSEAKRLNHNYIGTEHLLMGIMQAPQGLAHEVLIGFDVDLAQIQARLEEEIGLGSSKPFGRPTLAPRVKRVIELAVSEADRMVHDYIGTEHLLVGLIEEGQGAGVRVLSQFVDLQLLQQSILDQIQRRQTYEQQIPKPTRTRLTQRARIVLNRTEEEAIRLKHDTVMPEHLLMSVLKDPLCQASIVLREQDVSLVILQQEIERELGEGQRVQFGQPTVAPVTRELIRAAAQWADKWSHQDVGTEHLLMALLMGEETVTFRILANHTDLDSLIQQLQEAGAKQKVSQDSGRFVAMQKGPLISFRNMVWTFLGERLPGPDQERIVNEAVEMGAEKERQRLARDLHDSIKQQIFNISVSAAAVDARWETDPAGAKAALADVQQSAQAAMVEMNALLMQLQPNPLESVGLIDALREQCEALDYRTGAQVTSFFGSVPTDAQIPAETSLTIFRIAQESFTNIARHARASEVIFRLEPDLEYNLLRMEIRDDGQGFDGATTTTGMGLANLRERAAAIQARFVIESEPGQGTSIVVEVPFHEGG